MVEYWKFLAIGSACALLSFGAPNARAEEKSAEAKAGSEIIAGKPVKKVDTKPAPETQKPARSEFAAGVRFKSGPRCDRSGALGTSRVAVIDARRGQQFGSVNFDDRLLRSKEVVLTFDDGPLPKYTRAILKALDRECARATFFAVGRMAMAFPSMLREVADRGHTIAGHTWSHPKMSRLSRSRGIKEFERGFSALQSAIGRPIAPFFRFPYLDSPKWVQEYMKKRNVAAFSIDVDSGDTRGYGVSRIVRKTMRDLERRKKGILLFHDIKPRTAAAIPIILRKLREKGYRVVHVEAKEPFKTKKDYDAQFEKRMLAKRKKERGRSLVDPKPAKAKPRRKTWPNAKDNPFDEAKAKSRARRRAALRRERLRRRAAVRRSKKRLARRAAAAKKSKPTRSRNTFTFETVFGQ